MISYAEDEVFSKQEKALYRKAVEYVKIAPDHIGGEVIRCHELARAVGRVLGLTHEDGRFGFVEHTWLWTRPRGSEEFAAPWVLPNILDVYVPGSMPQVQLVRMETGLPPRYYLSNVFDVVINEAVVDRLAERFRGLHL